MENKAEIRLKGITLSKGVGFGYCCLYEEGLIKRAPRYHISDADIQNELDRLDEAIEKTKKDLHDMGKRVSKQIGSAEGNIFFAFIMILEDQDFITRIKKGIKYNKENAEAIVKMVTDEYVGMFSNMNDEYIKERAFDISELGDRILHNLSRETETVRCKNQAYCFSKGKLIIVARRLTPQITVNIDKSKIFGFVSEHGGYNSHAGILSRGLKIPAISGIPSIVEKLECGDPIIIDGEKDLVIINPSEQTLDSYEFEISRQNRIKKFQQEIISINNLTKDGEKIDILANISNDNELEQAIKYNCSIGLYRTEFLFFASEYLPSEEEQLDKYKQVIASLSGQITTFRTLDIGGDKALKYFPMPKEENPFLGWRGIRVSIDRPEMFKIQLRALIQAGQFGKIKIMFPMITSVDELFIIKALYNACIEELINENVEIKNKIPLGIMVETPAIAISLETIIEEVDFISIGTNDLIQYTLAVDRDNEMVSKYYNPIHPSIMKLIKRSIDIANRYGKEVTLCGEMGSDKNTIPYLIGLGLRKLSVNPMFIPMISVYLQDLDTKDCMENVKNILHKTEIL